MRIEKTTNSAYVKKINTNRNSRQNQLTVKQDKATIKLFLSFRPRNWVNFENKYTRYKKCY